MSISNIVCGKWPTFSKIKNRFSHTVSLKVWVLFRVERGPAMYTKWRRLIHLAPVEAPSGMLCPALCPRVMEKLINWSEFSRKLLRCLEDWCTCRMRRGRGKLGFRNLEREGFVGSTCSPKMGLKERQSQILLRDAQCNGWRNSGIENRAWSGKAAWMKKKMQESEIAVDTLCMIFWDFCYYLEIGNTSLVDALINACRWLCKVNVLQGTYEGEEAQTFLHTENLRFSSEKAFSSELALQAPKFGMHLWFPCRYLHGKWTWVLLRS